MRRTMVALAIVVAVVLGATIPASAQSWFQFRVNPSNGDWRGGGFGDLPYTFNTTMLGFTGFLQFPGQKYGLRLNVDSGGLSSFSPSGLYTGGRWRWYDVGVGMPIKFGPASTLFFLGWGNNWWQADYDGGFSRQTSSGLALGVDLQVPLKGPWYFAGSATLGPGHNYAYRNVERDPPRFSGKAQTTIYSAALGYNLPTNGGSVEVGWRSGGFTVSEAGSIDGMETRWSGWFVGFTLRR